MVKNKKRKKRKKEKSIMPERKGTLYKRV